jgi:hypothetical protein
MKYKYYILLAMIFGSCQPEKLIDFQVSKIKIIKSEAVNLGVVLKEKTIKNTDSINYIIQLINNNTKIPSSKILRPSKIIFNDTFTIWCPRNFTECYTNKGYYYIKRDEELKKFIDNLFN